jgi:hypothetical protein
MPVRYLTSTPIDCRGYGNVTLTFWRWLGIENSFYDQAKVEVSDDGSAWATVWEHTDGTFCDGAWVECTYNISVVAENKPAIYIRWTMGPTDGSGTYPGWNIDDISFNAFLRGDFDKDDDVDLADLFILVYYWLRDNCAAPGWCGGTDLDKNGSVNFLDFAEFAAHYRK